MNFNIDETFGFVGDFKHLLIQFVQMKQSLGYDYKAEAKHLKAFSKFSLSFNVENHALTKELADAWTERRPSERDVTWARRHNYLKQFAVYLRNLGFEAYIPVCKTKINWHWYSPYIFTHDQLRQFFATCENIKPHGLTNKHIVLPVMFRLLYGCGLRISEAVALKLKDIDLKQGIITIRQSKFNKDRLIPMSPSLTLIMRCYNQKMHLYSTGEDYFFMKTDKHPFSADTIYKNFRTLLWKSGISHGGKGRGPRLHDLRHTFSVHSLNQMVRQGLDIYCALPILSTYLGHSSVEATEKYVRLTEEAYPEILNAVNKLSAYVFPEVKLQ